jgi:hypothetical protein
MEMETFVIKKFVFALTLMLLPGAAMAQHHEHAQSTTSKASAAHSNFARELMAKAELKLTADQLARLDVLAMRMDELHKKADHHAGAAKSKQDHAQGERKLHDDLLAVFNDEQLVKVRPLMKAHMEKCEHMKDAAKKTEHKH